MGYAVKKILSIASFLCLGTMILPCCKKKDQNTIVFGTSADYPPFEFYQGNTMVGFDIELGYLIAEILKKKAVFENMKFGAILATLENETIDVGLSTITETEERKKNFDFSQAYYKETLSLLCLKSLPLLTKEDLKNKKIACQLGTTMEIWLKENFQPHDVDVILMDTNNQCVEALKAGHVQGVLIDNTQGKAFAKANPTLINNSFAKSSQGYGAVLKKNSPLRKEINKALDILRENGTLEKLEKKWLGGLS